MDIDWIRNWCLSLPHTTEDVQWGSDLLFRIRKKMFAVVALEAGGKIDAGGKARLCFRCTPEVFAELIEMDGIIPAPYMARHHWVALTRLDALPRTELRRRIKESYELVKSKLPKKTLRELDANGAGSNTL
jgi:predicted DNA-binding protein (MmcQ/YjbR family)